MLAVFLGLTRIGKKVYSTLRKKLSSLRELLSMTTALFPAPVQKRTSSARIAEKLELELDFVRASLPARTRMTHPHILFSPVRYEPNYAYPLLIWLHGTGEDERQLTRIMPVISMRNYVAVAPRGLAIEKQTPLPTHPSPALDISVSAILQRPKEQYDWVLSENHLAMIEQRIFDCIAIAQERCNIANNRIFIAGFGTGGTAALKLATLYPECFSGAAMFGGEIPAAIPVFPTWQMTQPPSVLLGTDTSGHDHVCRVMELFYSAGLTADVREYADTQHLTSVMLKDLNRWMMQIVCPEVPLTRDQSVFS